MKYEYISVPLAAPGTEVVLKPNFINIIDIGDMASADIFMPVTATDGIELLLCRDGNQPTPGVLHLYAKNNISFGYQRPTFGWGSPLPGSPLIIDDTILVPGKFARLSYSKTQGAWTFLT